MDFGSILSDKNEQVTVEPSTLGVVLNWVAKGHYGAILSVYVRPEQMLPLILGLLRQLDGRDGRPTLPELVKELWLRSPDEYAELRRLIGEMERELLGEEHDEFEYPEDENGVRRAILNAGQAAADAYAATIAGFGHGETEERI